MSDPKESKEDQRHLPQGSGTKTSNLQVHRVKKPQVKFNKPRPRISSNSAGSNMSKLSEPLKQLINAAHAVPGTLKAPPNIRSTYSRIASSAKERGVGIPAWVTISTAATMTMNSPGSLVELFNLTQTLPSAPSAPQTAGLMREVGLKCISFNGIPRTINCLGAFREGLPREVYDSIPAPPSRQINSKNADQVVARGRALWNSIYHPFEDKLYDKLGQSHPNLPVHILAAHYGTLLSDPEPDSEASASLIKVGRVLTSIVGISCLRAQTGVGPQVTSHVFGLRKAFQDGSAEKDVEGGDWLATDEGNQWILHVVDEIVQALSQGRGSTFAPGIGGDLKAKL
ncbi:hypothetical protein HRR83_006574 [Exophiala dermatitidis]|uniref:Uncharacterized protein n=2 Tax=Exophiala dermatitidis TaxID=5970 RepID=H6BWD1_EXODN|nr:uncharacterized protein HMPREF1120_04151 [Exophiala dermatitidis NIH/UT8656]KAJ4514076.1 hypothetical protein HRR74_005734 [Exophiala dermatitidis]EHY56047.1 hypothetical protein HMPREF1120_04151 [Exophiala dermatitidis NIH/UT8656]KAJ4515441.1 hypothetical protein HRR73_005273 [Exophiala dermatitidis]KAJ4533724.1 hypothetical protein HRR77_008209 [Exophiala dermatitidis]KAJ4540970.1 hypothetical protein HRR76_004352 [Exophiala dermatitidis]